MANMANNTSLLMVPECFNIYREDVLKDPNGTVLLVFYCINMIFITVTNVALIFGLVKTSGSKMTRTNKLFIFLSINDLSVGLILMPLFIRQVAITPTSISCLENIFHSFWNVFPLALSGSHILLISIDRYLMIAKNIWHKSTFTDKVLLKTIFLEMLLSFCWAAGYAYVTRYYNLKNTAIYFMCLSVYEVVIVVSAMKFNLMILRNVNKTVATATSLNRNEKYYNKILPKTIMCITGTLALCYSPTMISFISMFYFLFYSEKQDDLRYTIIALMWSVLPATMNSALNSCIYISRNTKLRNYYKAILCAREDNDDDRESSEKSTTVF